MGVNSKIEWTEDTWNPWHGCRKVSPGCKYCYMFRDKERYKKDPREIIRSVSNFNAPFRQKTPSLIFTCSWSDFFIKGADAWRGDAWDVIRRTPEHTYQILTKRPENVLNRLPDDWGENGYKNVWLGVSVENDDFAHRVDTLFEVPARLRFASAEPIIGPVNFTPETLKKLDWVIIGGESGNKTGKYRYRPADIAWFEVIIQQCRAAGVPVFVKQLGCHLAESFGLKDRFGKDINEWPAGLQVRQMPDKHQ